MKKALKIVLIVIVCLVALLGLFILGYNVFKRAIYPEYYQIQTDLAPNQGLGDGYVPQDLTSYKYNDNLIYFTCGYMTSKDKPSRIYMIRDNEKEKYFELKDKNDEYITTEFAGITIYDKYLFVAGGQQLYMISLEQFFNSITEEEKNLETTLTDVYGDYVTVNNSFNLQVSGDCLFAYDNATTSKIDDLLFIGDYVDDSKDNGILVNDDTTYYSAKVRSYSLSDLIYNETLTLKASYIIRDKVSGLAIHNNKLVLVSDAGFLASYFYVYDLPKTFDDGNTYYIDDRYLKETIKGPMLAAGLDYNGEMFISLFNSASNKYIIGKFLSANKIVGLKIE